MWSPIQWQYKRLETCELASDVCGLHGPVHAALTDVAVYIGNGSLDTNRLKLIDWQSANNRSVSVYPHMYEYFIVPFVWEGR